MTGVRVPRVISKEGVAEAAPGKELKLLDLFLARRRLRPIVRLVQERKIVKGKVNHLEITATAST